MFRKLAERYYEHGDIAAKICLDGFKAYLNDSCTIDYDKKAHKAWIDWVKQCQAIAEGRVDNLNQ